jgi:hypothetical protein
MVAVVIHKIFKQLPDVFYVIRWLQLSLGLLKIPNFSIPVMIEPVSIEPVCVRDVTYRLCQYRYETVWFGNAEIPSVSVIPKIYKPVVIPFVRFRYR